MKHDIQEKGFTLIEIIISLAIFTVVAVVAIGALLKIMNANNKAQGLQTTISSMNYALESMTRELRQATAYHCDSATDSYPRGVDVADKACADQTPGLPDTYVTLAYETQIDALCEVGGNLVPVFKYVYAYRLYTDTATPPKIHLQKAEQSGCLNDEDGDIESSAYADVLPPDVTITSYVLDVKEDAESPTPAHPYPNAFISLSGYSGAKESQRTYFNLQTDVAGRSYSR